MKRLSLIGLLAFAIGYYGAFGANRPEDQSQGAQTDLRGLMLQDNIDPEQTADDPSYGYSLENPVKLGELPGLSGPRAERLYLRHLRDAKLRPISFKRLGSYRGNPDEHLVDEYVLTDEDGKSYTIYIDMYHPDMNPLYVKAPKGMYFWK